LLGRRANVDIRSRRKISTATNHAPDLAASDLFVVATIGFKLVAFGRSCAPVACSMTDE